MEDIFSPSVATQDPLKRASQEAHRLGRDVKEGLEDAASRGRSIADDAMRSAKDLAQDGGTAIADRAREAAAEARRRASRAAARVSDYADDNTAIVAVAALAIGLLVGYALPRRQH